MLVSKRVTSPMSSMYFMKTFNWFKHLKTATVFKKTKTATKIIKENNRKLYFLFDKKFLDENLKKKITQN